MTTTTTGWMTLSDEDGTWVVFENDYRHGSFDTQEEANEYVAECKAQIEADDEEERRDALRGEIALLLENVTRLDSLEGLLKSVKRLQD
jgi:hypothetical protein